MKKRSIILITLILIFLSGCIETKVYLGREDPGPEQVYGAVNPTEIPAGITWGTFRGYINENFEEVDLAIDTLDNGLADAVDSIAAHRAAIELRLLKSDSTIFASQHDLATGLANQAEWDDAYTNRVTSASGTAPLNLSLSSNAITGTIDQASTSSAGTMSAADKLKLDHMKDSIEKALDDAFGVGAELSNLVVMREDSLGATNEFYVPVYAFIQAMQNQVHVADSNKTSSGNYITNKKLVDYVAANQGSAEGITLNGGTLTLTGDGGTADNVTIYTNGDGQYEYPVGGGILTRMGDVQDWISDSIAAARRADSDTIPLFIFGAGSGHWSDTTLFSDGRLAGAFYNSGSDTLYVTELRGVLVEGTGTETISAQVSWNVNMKDVSPANLNTNPVVITSTTTGNTFTSFANNGIPPGRWVWCTLSGASKDNKPTMLVLTMTGYKRNRSY